MEFRDVIEIARYSPEKMQKLNLFESRNFFCDVYCLEPGQSQKVHAHQTEDKLYYVLEGTGAFTIGTEEQEHGSGCLILAPSGVEHGVRNTSAARLKLLVFMAPHPDYK
jgi:mannose-6-phosphate isomerase-like protein (cupin superfamily)